MKVRQLSIFVKLKPFLLMQSKTRLHYYKWFELYLTPSLKNCYGYFRSWRALTLPALAFSTSEWTDSEAYSITLCQCQAWKNSWGCFIERSKRSQPSSSAKNIGRGVTSYRSPTPQSDPTLEYPLCTLNRLPHDIHLINLQGELFSILYLSPIE